MAGAVDITIDDLCRSFNADTVRAVFCDDGTGRPGPRLEESLSIARRLGDAILLKGWSPDQIEILIQEDAAIRALVCRLVIAQGMQGKAEWTGAGAPFENLEARTFQSLERIATGQARSIAESAGAGPNPNVAGSQAPSPPCYTFASSRDRPRRGGY